VREFRKFFTTIETRVPARPDVHLILDNSSTHKTPAIHRWSASHPRFHLHFTPTGVSWINLVERWFAALTEKQLRRGVHRSTRELELAIHRYIEITNAHPKHFIWTKTADEILASVARFVSESLTQDTSRSLRRAHLLRWRPRSHAQRTESTSRVRLSSAVAHPGLLE